MLKFKFFAKHYNSWPLIDGILTKKKQLIVHDTIFFKNGKAVILTQNFIHILASYAVLGLCHKTI
jgi:hypothetical protein